MKFFITYLHIIVISIFIVNCGGGTSVSSNKSVPVTITEDTTPANIPLSSFVKKDTTITIDMNRLYLCDVTDSNGQRAFYNSPYSAKYIFRNEPSYPISATNCWLDLNADFTIGQDDYLLNINITSDTDIITPDFKFITESDASYDNSFIDDNFLELNNTSSLDFDRKYNMYTMFSSGLYSSVYIYKNISQSEFSYHLSGSNRFIIDTNNNETCLDYNFISSDSTYNPNIYNHGEHFCTEYDKMDGNYSIAYLIK